MNLPTRPEVAQATTTTVLSGPSPIAGDGPSAGQRSLDNVVWAWLVLVVVVASIVVAVSWRRSRRGPSRAADAHR
jgi:hypothetical protein